ncbi:MAG: hypothetical protein NT043_00480, partial [Candidatus Bathyarchaeota archaeon]|nr:hypothetical protein [Candidatus Bathyarchaeota archaeon]
MKVTIAVLDKQGKSVLERVIVVLKAFDVVQPSHFGLISPKRSPVEKNLDVLRKQGMDSSTLVGYLSSKPKSANGYEFLKLDDAALVFEGRV